MIDDPPRRFADPSEAGPEEPEPGQVRATLHANLLVGTTVVLLLVALVVVIVVR